MAVGKIITGVYTMRKQHYLPYNIKAAVWMKIKYERRGGNENYIEENQDFRKWGWNLKL